LAASDDLWEHSFGAFGFPAGYDDGVWTSGVLRGRTANGRIQIDGEADPGYWIKPGFSGTAIWDTELDAVVGMAVTADMDAEVKVAYMIPARALLAAWPEMAASPACDSSSAPNPFCDRGRINDPARLFDRTRDLRELRQALAAGNSISLVGARQIGKSSLLYALYQTAEAWLPEKRVHYIDLQGVLDEADFAAEGVENARFRRVTAPADYAALPAHDFLFSRIVLQHNPPPVQCAMLSRLFARLAPGGAALFQLVTRIHGYAYALEADLARPDGGMEMHALPQEHVFALMAEAGLVPVEVQEDSAAGDRAIHRSHVFLARKPA
jgi:hypothetical protein